MLKRLKPYKNVTPEETVYNIRKILYQKGIFVIESVQSKEPLTGVCSCRIILGDESLRDYNIGSNGKGMNAKYALASAYAEFLERLQNGALLWKKTGIPFSSPGAVNVSQSKMKQLCQELLRIEYGDHKYVDIISDEYSEQLDKCKALTFREYSGDSEVQIPIALYNKMSGSNGMAAGNTVIEAVIQGLSEVFEREAVHKLFLEPFTPPQIDESLFKGTEVLVRLKKLVNIGVKFRILDCSLGKRLPVIGLLIEKNGLFHIQFGADPSPITALERCLTETFQGRTINEIPFYPLLPAGSDEKVYYENEWREFSDSSGRVPAWILNTQPSWDFQGFEHPVTYNDEDDMQYYHSILKSMNKKLYIRETNVLGFPAVRIYVPQMTVNHCPKIEYCSTHKLNDKTLELLGKLPLLVDEQFACLADEIIAFYQKEFGYKNAIECTVSDLGLLEQAFPPGNFPGLLWDKRVLFAAILFRAEIYDVSSYFLESYIKEKKIAPEKANILRVRIKSHKMFFSPMEWPQCPNCNNCKAANYCGKETLERLQLQFNKLLRK